MSPAADGFIGRHTVIYLLDSMTQAIVALPVGAARDGLAMARLTLMEAAFHPLVVQRLRADAAEAKPLIADMTAAYEAPEIA